MSWLNVDEELLNDVEAEKVSEYKVPESGIYDAKPKQAFLWKAGSGAVMFTIEMETKQGDDLEWTTCIVSGDEKGNKSTYTDKNGKEKLLPGVISAIHLFQSVGLDFAKENPEVATIERKGKKEDVKVFKALRGKPFKACVRQYEDLYQGETIIKYDIENFLDKDGKNKDGEDMTEKFLARIEKAPIKKKKAGGSTGTATTSDEVKEKVAESGW